MKLTLSTTGINHKPTSDEYKKRIYQMKPFETESIPVLFTLIAEEGYSYRDCVSSGTLQTDFISQEIITLDFDSGFTVDEFGERCKELNIMPNLIYYTFSHTEEHHKYRAVFFLNETITDLLCARSLKRCLNYLFPEADQIKNVAQVYQGSNKGIRYYCGDYKTSIVQIMFLACQKLKENDISRHYARDRKVLLMLETDVLKCAKKVRTPIYNYSTMQDFGAKIQFVEPKTSDEIVEEDSNFDWDIFLDSCKLFRDSMSGEHWIEEPELFFLMSGLKNKRGSAKRLNQIIDIAVKNHPSEYNLATIKARKERIKSCDAMYRRCQGVCPFYDSCKAKSLETVKNGIVQRIEPYTPIELSDAEKQLSEAMRKAWNDGRNISIIKCDTGVGKTEVMKRFIENHPELKICIAVPTHKLADEIQVRTDADRFTVIPELNLDELEPDLAVEYKKYAMCGKYADAYKVLYQSKVQSILMYISIKWRFDKGFIDNAIITHKRFFQSPDLTKYDVVFVDEDAILKSMDVVQVTKDDFYSDLPDVVLEWSEQINDGLNELKRLPETKIKEIMKNIDNLKFNLNDILHSDLCYASDDCFYFSKMNYFPKAKKIIMFSATVNDAIASRYCYNMNKSMEFYKIPNVKLKGKLLQFTDMPSSRTALSENTVEKFKNCITVSLDPHASVCTFVKFKRELENSGYEVSCTFGALEGIDSLNGKNLNIIGTYRVLPQIYLLFAKSLWGEIETRHETQSYQIHTFNGFRFKMMAPEHMSVREVMFYMILSESVQAVGRARLTRNEESKVTLFSKVPLKEAKIFGEI